MIKRTPPWLNILSYRRGFRYFRSSLARDYFLFAMLLVLVPVGFVVYQGIVINHNQSTYHQERLDTTTNALEQALTESFDETQDLAEFIGDKITRHGAENFSQTALLIERRFTIDVMFRNIYSLVLFSWLDANDRVRITAQEGILNKPEAAASAYPVTQAKYSPWELQIGPVIHERSVEEYVIVPTSMAIEDNAGNFLGTLIAKIPITHIQQKIEQALGDNKLQYIIFDKQFNVLMKSDTTSKHQASMTFKPLSDLLFSEKEEGKFEEPVNYNGVQYTSYSRSSYPFIIVTGYPESFLSTELKNALYPYLYEAGIMFLAFTSALWVFRKRAISGIIHLSGIFTRISIGDENIEVREHHKTQSRKPKYPPEIHNLRIAATKSKLLKRREKRQQRELQKANFELAERTAQLQQTKVELEHAIHIAENSDKAREKLIRSIRHNTKSALNGVKYPLQVLLAHYDNNLHIELEPKRQREYIKSAMEYVEHVEAFTTDILSEELIDVAEIIEQCITINTKAAYGRGVEITYSVKRQIPKLYADYTRFTQIVNGLIHRAMDILPSGKKIMVHLSVKKENNQDNLVLRITDNGFGLSQEERDKIVNDNGGSNLSRNVDGTELSVSSINKLIILHNGELHIEDRPGEGSIITLNLPYRQPSEHPGDDTDDLEHNLPANVARFPKQRLKS